MSNLDAVKKVMLYQKDKSGFVKEPTVKEMADLVVLVLNSVKQIEQAIESKRLDIDKKFSTPINEALSKGKEGSDALLTQVTNSVNDLLSRGEANLNQTTAKLEEQVRQAIANIHNGDNGIVSEEEIQRAAAIALGMLELPDFDALVTEAITSNSEAIRNSLELLTGEDRYKVEIADVQGLTEALNQLATIRAANGGTIGKQQVYNFIRQAIADGTITAGGGSTTVETPTGTVNSSNVSFTVTATPKFIVADNTTYFEGFGYSLAGLNVTMELAPNNFIRAII